MGCRRIAGLVVLVIALAGHVGAQNPPAAPEPTITITIRGAVNAPGTYTLKQSEGLIALIMQAGNFSLGPRRPALRKLITIQHDADNGGNTEAVDWRAEIRRDPNLTATPLRNGDVVTIPIDWGTVYVGGVAAHVGSYEVPEEAGLSLYDAVNLAGGVADGIALHRIFIRNARGPILMDPRVVVIKSAEVARDVMLHDADTVFISSQLGWGQVFITGPVRRPGSVNILEEDGVSLTDVINLAGGLGPRATLDNIRIANVHELSPKKERILSLDTLEAGRGVILHDGDIVSVGHLPPAEPIPPTVKPKQRVWQASRGEPTTSQSRRPRRATSST